MAVRSEVYNTVPGQSVLNVPGLAFRQIVSVKRQGLGYDIITSGSVGNRQVLYGVAGSFEFMNPFIGSADTSSGIVVITSEKIHVIWHE